MAFARHVWQQIKNLTADDLIDALERDGWQEDKSSGAFRPYIDPATRKRVIIHYHPRKTYGPNLLQSLLSEIGWNESDLIRLKLIKGKQGSGSGGGTAKQRKAEIGDENPNGQLFVRETDQQGTDHNQFVWELLCRHCGNKYGANGSDFHHRKCPACQGGAAGIEIQDSI